MRATQLLMPTLRETPAEAEVISHKLMLRAGMLRKAAAGVYSFLPLAHRVLQKIKYIVRDEMNKKGGQELMLPIIQPAELWQESGRWDVYGDELFRLKDRHGRDFALGPTHEEIITDLVRGDVRSYKQLPVLLYQIQNKYRDERRPRFGLMRGREFIMKDLYSFDRDQEGLDISYQKMYEAYNNIFNRCGLRFRPVDADPGAIGGSGTHEFMVIAESGEAAIVYCDGCNYAANIEKAEARPVLLENKQAPEELKAVATPNVRTVSELAEFSGVAKSQLVKTMIYQTEKENVVALVTGTRQINEIKLQNHLGSLQLALAEESVVRAITGAAPGFAGPIGLEKIRIIVDPEVAGLVNTITGGNKTDVHYINVNPGRDFPLKEVVDIRVVEAGEPCPQCGEALKAARGIEVGQVFKLGTKYSKALDAKYLDEKGQEQLMVMGCYGIGVSRTLAAAIEQNYDQNGIIWPMAIAPFQVVIVPVNIKDEEQRKAAEVIYQELMTQGVEVLLDDREERAGVKFKDADLIGYPLRINLGKALVEGKVEIVERKTGQVNLVELQEASSKIINLVKKGLEIG